MPSQKQVQIEVDASYLYGILARHETNSEIAEIFSEMSEIEMSHAQAFWKSNNTSLPGPSFQARMMEKLAKYFGYDFILWILMETEKSMSYSILSQKKNTQEKVDFGDTSHVAILKNILDHHPGIEWSDIARFEKRHKSIGGNALRAGVLGGNDGLVSNFSLVMWIAGATSGNNEIILAGSAGLLAGALSMALWEWISVKSSQELYENQIELEKEELELHPEGEEKELVLIYRSKWIPLEESKRLAAEVIQNTQQAHHILVKEELGIDEEGLKGSAMEAALSSFFLFAIGAIIPVFPFFFWEGNIAILISCIMSGFGLFAIGSLITLFTGKSVLYSGMRQVLFGAGAAAITFTIGTMIGTSIIG
jgi:vacuolar iron transporter family protein